MNRVVRDCGIIFAFQTKLAKIAIKLADASMSLLALYEIVFSQDIGPERGALIGSNSRETAISREED